MNGTAIHAYNLNKNEYDSTMRCPKCAVDDRPGEYCLACGTALIEVVRSCQSCGNAKIFGPFCHECGAEVDQKDACSSCGAENQAGKFCTVCGASRVTRQEPLDASPIGIDENVQVKCASCGRSRNAYRRFENKLVEDLRPCGECGMTEGWD